MSTTATRRFVAKNGSRFSDEQAERYGMRIESLRDSEGTVEPEVLVADGEDPSSPLHDAFEWDDPKAAHKYRITQARKVLRSIEVEIVEEPEQEPQRVRAFYNVDTDKDTQAYVDIDTVRSNKTYREQIIEKALGELQGWRRRYEQYKEFSPVVEAVDAVTEQIEAA